MRITSQQVCWFEVYLFVARLLASVGSRPTAGTPEWMALADDDPRKLAAVADLGVHMALRIDTNQAAVAAASRAIAGSTRWRSLARRQDRGSAYVPRLKEIARDRR